MTCIQEYNRRLHNGAGGEGCALSVTVKKYNKLVFRDSCAFLPATGFRILRNLILHYDGHCGTQRLREAVMMQSGPGGKVD